MLAPVLVTPPATAPVTVAEVKSWARVDSADEDTLIGTLINAATGYLDGYSGVLGRALVTQTWRFDMPCWRYPVRLPLAPVQSVVVAYSDASNADQTFVGAGYSLLSDGIGPRLELNSGYSWPSLYSRHDAIRVTAVVGYGNASAVPEPLKLAIKIMVAFLLNNRAAAAKEAADASIVFWGPYRRHGI